MPDNLSPLLDAPEWDIPLTEHFVDRVRAGMRRRSQRRLAVRGVAVLGAAAAVFGVLAASGVLRPNATAPPVAPATSPVVAPLDGYAFGYLPPGVTAAGPDGQDSARLTEAGLDREGRQPAAGETGATITMRWFTRANQGSVLFLTVLRPVPGAGLATSREVLLGWIVDWLAAPASRLAPSYSVPVGTAYLVEHRGTEVTTFSLIVVTNDAVIPIEGPSSLTPDVLRQIAEDIRLA